MGLFTSKTDEERAAVAARRQAERDQRDHAKWLTTPPGRARAAYQRGDQLFQVGLELAAQIGEVAHGVGLNHHTQFQDANPVINAIAAEGWELVSMSTVYVINEMGSRDKLTVSGQQTAVSGKTIGYYVFRRRD